MKKSKYLLVIVISLFFFFPCVVNAKCGDLIYEVTEFKVTDEKIIFEGWAFIHFTNNSRDKKTYGSVSYGGGQEVMIVAENKSTGEKKYLKNILYDDGYSGSNADKLKKYNFYYMQFFDKRGGSVENEYLYNLNHLTGKYDANSCNITDRSCGASECHQCLFEDIGFHIEADISSFNVSETAEYNFYIYATNDDYNSKYNNGICNGTEIGKLKGKKEQINYYSRSWAGSEIYIAESVKKGSSDKIKVNTDAISKNKVYTTVEHGLPRVFSGGKYSSLSGMNYIYNGEFTYTGRTIDTDCSREYKCGPGDYIIKVDISGRYPGSYTTAKIYRSWALPAGRATLALTFLSDKKCEVDSAPKKSSTLSCNENKKIVSECSELTVKDKNNKTATVSIKQTGIIANLLTPTEIYNGGGIKFGLLYHNMVEFKRISGDEGISMSDVIKNRINGTDNITLDVKLDDAGIVLNKDCKQKFNEDSATVETICIFLFKPQTVNENGTISDIGTDLGINNKYYLPLEYDKSVYKLSATLKNASILKVETAKGDSKEKNIAWYGEKKWESISLPFNDSDNSCNINVYKLGPGGSTTSRSSDGSKEKYSAIYNYIYRPIDLGNPFPGYPSNRSIGFNWSEWYKKEGNKDRLKDSYNKLDYEIVLDNYLIKKVKEYNKGKNYFDFDYDAFEDVVNIDVGGIS